VHHGILLVSSLAVFRIRIRIGFSRLDPDPGGKK
jgi:hypothetical protein